MLETVEYGDQICRLGNCISGHHMTVYITRSCDDMSQRRLTEATRTIEQDMSQAIFSDLCRLDRMTHHTLDIFLTDKLLQRSWTPVTCRCSLCSCVYFFDLHELTIRN